MVSMRNRPARKFTPRVQHDPDEIMTVIEAVTLTRTEGLTPDSNVKFDKDLHHQKRDSRSRQQRPNSFLYTHSPLTTRASLGDERMLRCIASATDFQVPSLVRRQFTRRAFRRESPGTTCCHFSANSRQIDEKSVRSEGRLLKRESPTTRPIPVPRFSSGSGNRS
jgi:hypothetical protein